MRKHWMKLTIDLIMAIVLFTLFSIRSTGLNFHEIAGLVIFGVTIVHLLLNWRWIVSFTKRLFATTTPIKIRVGYGLNVLLLISFVMITLSGIMLSKVVFADLFTESDNAKTVHYFFSAFSLLLIGIHIGLHWPFIKAMLSRVIKLPFVLSKTLGGLMIVVVLLGGIYSLTTSSFIPWLVSPVLTIETDDESFSEGLGGGQGGGQGRHNQGLETDETTENYLGGGGYRGGLGVSFNTQSTAMVIAEYGSITVLIAMLTAVAEAQFNKRRKKTRSNLA